MSDLSLEAVLLANFQTSADADKRTEYLKSNLGLSARYRVARLALGRSLSEPTFPTQNIDAQGKTIKGELLFGMNELSLWVGLLFTHTRTVNPRAELNLATLQNVVKRHWHRGIELLMEDWTEAGEDFLVAILGAGGLGIWVELYKMTKAPNMHGVITAIYTYYLAIAAGAAFQIALDANSRRYVLSFAFLSFVLCILPAFLHAVGVMKCESTSLLIGTIWSVAALALWWIANGKNLSLLDVVIASDALGANPSDRASGNSGGFDVTGR